CIVILAAVFARLRPVLTAFLPALHGVRKRAQNVYPYNVRFHCHHGLLRFRYMCLNAPTSLRLLHIDLCAGERTRRCAGRYLGFCPPSLQAAPMEMMAFLARQLQIDPTALQTYGMRRMTRSAHFNAVLNHLGFRRVQPKDHEPLLTWLT